MKLFFSLFVIIVLLCGFFLLYFYFENTKKVGSLYSPYISTNVGEVAGDATESGQLESEIPVNCVLSYGTYLVNQESCDELGAIDTSPDPDAEMVSCTLKDGTFSFTQRECDLLKKSVGSKDVLKTLD